MLVLETIHYIFPTPTLPTLPRRAPRRRRGAPLPAAQPPPPLPDTHPPLPPALAAVAADPWCLRRWGWRCDDDSDAAAGAASTEVFGRGGRTAASIRRRPLLLLIRLRRIERVAGRGSRSHLDPSSHGFGHWRRGWEACAEPICTSWRISRQIGGLAW